MFKYSMIGLGIAQLILLIARFSGAIAWSWPTVLVPIIIAAVSFVLLVVSALIITLARG